MKKKEILVEKVNEIIGEYTMKLTLRQIYYRLVSKHIIENVMSQYKYLSKVLVDARLNGEVSFESIEDRTRHFNNSISWVLNGNSRLSYSHPFESWTERTPIQHFKDYMNNFRNADRFYELPRWKDQPKYVEIWVEKEALSGLFWEVCKEQHTTLAPCRGYPSLTYMYEMYRRLAKLKNKDIELQVLYFGDHDPSGRDIQRTVEDYFETFGVVANFEKVAITKEQIKEYNIPPMPVKRSDSRANRFIEEEGDEAVELDAIEPDILQQIIRDSIDWHFDNEIYEEVLEEQEDGKVRIKDMIKKKIKTN